MDQDCKERSDRAQVATAHDDATALVQRKRATVGPRSLPMAPFRVEASALATDLLHNAGMTSSVIAAGLGVSRQFTDKWFDRRHEASITLRDLLAVRRKFPAFWTDLVRQLEALGSEPPPSRLPHATHGLLVAGEAGDVARAMVCPTSSRAEKRKELREVIAAAERALADLDAEERADARSK